MTRSKTASAGGAVSSRRSAVRLPPGVRDFLPHATARRTSIAAGILERFDRWGYQRIITPQFEVADVMERGLGPEASRGAIRFIEPEGSDVAILRPDMTPQVARIAATRLDETGGPLRLCYEGTVVREGRGARRQREILQAGVELIGAPSPQGDSEIVALAAEVLLAASASESRLEVGHVGPAHALVEDIDDEALRGEIEAALYRRDLSAMRRLTDTLPETLATALNLLPRMSGPVAEIEALARRAPRVVRSALSELREIINIAHRLAPDAMTSVEIVLDLGEVGRFPYYTGARVAGWLAGVGDAVLLGGRYDQLVAQFGRDRQATGFAVDIEALAQAQLAAGVPSRAGEGVLIVGRSRRAVEIAAGLRASGVRATLEIGGLRGKKAPVRYAAASGLAAVLFVGDSGAELVAADRTTRISEAVVVKASAGNRQALAKLRTMLSAKS